VARQILVFWTRSITDNLGVHGGAIHEAAIVYLRADHGTVRLKYHRLVSTPRPAIKTFKILHDLSHLTWK
jgi:hypothetical protein